MNRTACVFFFAIALLATAPLSAQEDKSKSDQAKSNESPHAAIRPTTWYRVDLVVNEFEDGKKVNARHYSIHLNDTGDRSVTKFGTRVPVPSGPPGAVNATFNYMDVGMNFNMRIVGPERNVVEMGFDLSSFAIPEQAKQTAPGVPIVRQVQTSGSIPVTTSKPLVVASLEDPNSTKRYQFEATITKL